MKALVYTNRKVIQELCIVVLSLFVKFHTDCCGFYGSSHTAGLQSGVDLLTTVV